MFKRGIIVLLTVIWLFSMSSCGVIEYVQYTIEDLKERSALDEEAKINWVSGDAIEYQGTTYNLFIPSKEWASLGDRYMDFENDVFIGWGGMRYGYVDLFYADTEENPLFIYERRLDWIFFREGYDYLTDLYRVEGTEAFISYSDALTETNLSFQRDKDYDTYTVVKLVCKSHARMELELDVIYADGVWYGVHQVPNKVYLLSDKLMEVLLNNKIIAGGFNDFN